MRKIRDCLGMIIVWAVVGIGFGLLFYNFLEMSGQETYNVYSVEDTNDTK